jgi:hypothetical protein
MAIFPKTECPIGTHAPCVVSIIRGKIQREYAATKPNRDSQDHFEWLLYLERSNAPPALAGTKNIPSVANRLIKRIDQPQALIDGSGAPLQISGRSSNGVHYDLISGPRNDL